MRCYDQVEALFLAGKYTDAHDIIQRHRAELQADAAGCTLIAAVLNALSEPLDSLAALTMATMIAPESATAWQNRGSMLRQLGHYGEARDCFETSVTLDPSRAAGWFSLGQAQFDLDHLGDALGSFDMAIDRDAALVAAHAARGLVLHRLGRVRDALAAYETTLGLHADEPETWINLGVLYQEQGMLEEGLLCFDTAIMRRPDLVTGWTNRAKALRALGRIAAAIESFDAALRLCPDDPVVILDRGLCRLLLGDYRQGLADYEARLVDGRRGAAASAIPVWRGEPLAGRRLLVTGEQGFGDTFQFIRFIAPLIAMGARVTLQVPPEMADVLATVTLCPIVSTAVEARDFDVQVALMSLPHRLAVDTATIPASVPYLQAHPAAVTSWQRRIGGDGFRIGIAWQGNPTFADDANRSVPLSAFTQLSGLAGTRLISLQRRDGLDQLDALGEQIGIEVLPDDVDSHGAFVDTAAILLQMDLVVTSDTAIAHLAGALGCPVWLALPQVPDWRWGMSGETSPWYPTMRLFRQSGEGWYGVFRDMRLSLLASGTLAGAKTLEARSA